MNNKTWTCFCYRWHFKNKSPVHRLKPIQKPGVPLRVKRTFFSLFFVTWIKTCWLWATSSTWENSLRSFFFFFQEQLIAKVLKLFSTEQLLTPTLRTISWTNPFNDIDLQRKKGQPERHGDAAEAKWFFWCATGLSELMALMKSDLSWKLDSVPFCWTESWDWNRSDPNTETQSVKLDPKGLFSEKTRVVPNFWQRCSMEQTVIFLGVINFW